jgi:hypothetical protein
VSCAVWVAALERATSRVADDADSIVRWIRQRVAASRSMRSRVQRDGTQSVVRDDRSIATWMIELVLGLRPLPHARSSADCPWSTWRRKYSISVPNLQNSAHQRAVTLVPGRGCHGRSSADGRTTWKSTATSPLLSGKLSSSLLPLGSPILMRPSLLVPGGTCVTSSDTSPRSTSGLLRRFPTAPQRCESMTCTQGTRACLCGLPGDECGSPLRRSPVRGRRLGREEVAPLLRRTPALEQLE